MYLVVVGTAEDHQFSSPGNRGCQWKDHTECLLSVVVAGNHQVQVKSNVPGLRIGDTLARVIATGFCSNHHTDVGLVTVNDSQSAMDNHRNQGLTVALVIVGDSLVTVNVVTANPELGVDDSPLTADWVGVGMTAVVQGMVPVDAGLEAIVLGFVDGGHVGHFVDVVRPWNQWEDPVYPRTAEY